MSVGYGGRGYSPYYGPTGKVNFGWLTEAWEIYQRSWWVWSLSTLIYGAVIIAMVIPLDLALIGNAANLRTASANPFAANRFAMFAGVPVYLLVGLYLGMTVLGLFMSSSFLSLGLKAVRREPIDFLDAFSGFRPMWRLFLFGLMIGIIGLILSFLPMALPHRFQTSASIVCTVLSILYNIATYTLLMPGPAMVADGASPIEALFQSVSTMKRSFFVALLFIVVAWIVLVVITLLTCDLGIVVTMPIGFIISVLAYRDMVGMSGIIEPNFGYGSMYAPQPPSAGVWPPPPQEQQPGYWPPQDTSQHPYSPPQDPGSVWPPPPPGSGSAPDDGPETG